MTPNTGWQAAKKILCIRLDHFGDVLMATPALRALKESFTGCRLTLLASPAGTSIARHIPEIDDTIEYAAPWMKSSVRHDSMHHNKLIAHLRDRRFDGAVIFTTYSQSALPAALLCLLADIPLRLAHCRENPYQMLTDWIPEQEPQQKIRHEVRRQLDLVNAIGARASDDHLSFALHPDDLLWADAQFESWDIDRSQPWLLLHPGSTAPSRRYPPAFWATAAAELSRRLSCAIVVSGSTDDVPLTDEIIHALQQRHRAARVHTIAGQTSIGRLAALMSHAALVLTNNTGPAHLAAALSKPIVELYALTNPQHTPWNTPSRVLFHDVPCRFCYKSECPQVHHDCLRKVHPDRVVAAALELLGSAANMSSGLTDGGKPLALTLPA